MPGRRAGIAVVLVATALAGCGGGSSDAGLTGGQKSGLLAQLEAARAAAAGGSVAGTEAAIRKFRVSVTRLQRSGALTDTQARTLRLGAQRVLARVTEDNRPPTATTPTLTTPAPTPPAPHGPPGHEKKPKKHGHGRGHGAGEGKD